MQRGTDYVNAWSSGIHAGARYVLTLVQYVVSDINGPSWNKNLARQRATHMGYEYRRKGVNMMLGPVVSPIGRVAEGGRNWEGFSTDPYQSGALVYETVVGVQSVGVAASTKVSPFHTAR